MNKKEVALSRNQMKKELLALPKGVAGMVWHVGSDPSAGSFNSIVLPEAKRSGFVSWIQGNSVLEDMSIQPLYLPQLGITYDSFTGKLVLDTDKIDGLQQALGSSQGLDLHPDAAPGWYEVVEKASGLVTIQLLKTQIAAPGCTGTRLNSELADYQPFIYRSLVKGHIDQARKLSNRVVLSIDDPTPFSVETLRENLSTMLGDKFDKTGCLESTEIEVMRAIHSCGSYDLLGVVETKAVDVVHWDAWKYESAPLRGKPGVLESFIDNNGLFAWGGVPQSLPYLEELGDKLGIQFKITSQADYYKLSEDLERKKTKALDLVGNNYSRWLKAISKELDLSENEIARRTFISATCGYGSNHIPPLREFAYDLSRSIAEMNKEIAKAA